MNATLNPSDVLKSNPLFAFATVTYSYTQEYGSDGCWSGTAYGKCTLREWVAGIHHRHPGNRSYDFALESIEEFNEALFLSRQEVAALELAEARSKRNAEAAAKKAAKDRFAATIASWVGVSVTVKKKPGTVERAMESRYDEGRIVMLVHFADGTKKWHGEGVVKRA